MQLSKILSSVQDYGVLFIIIYIAAISHELAHGYTAYLLGDNTAKEAGRLSFNPLRHIDIVRTIIFPIILVLIGFFPLVMFKPVPINERNFKNPRVDSIKVALAGPGSNLLFIIISITILNIFKLFKSFSHTAFFKEFLLPFFFLFLLINLILMTFNLLPIPPLDGSWVIRGLLPVRWRYYYQKSYTYIVIIFIILIVSGKFHYIFIPILGFFWKIASYLIR